MPQTTVLHDHEAGLTLAESERVQLPLLTKERRLSIDDLRDPYERIYLAVLWLTNGLAIVGLCAVAVAFPRVLLLLGSYAVVLSVLFWISWKLTLAFVFGHSIEVGPNQYPQIYSVVKQASILLDVPIPTILVMQGHGMFELLVAKRFTRRGLIIVTSNMLDEFCNQPSSREFMMFIGRQLGHLKAGHFRWWFCKDVVGKLSLFFNQAYWRRCHFTADRIGMLVAGDLKSAELALCMITVGTKIAPSTNLDEVGEQRTRLLESTWAWIQVGLSSYPYMVDRIVRLRSFAQAVSTSHDRSAPRFVGALPIEHHRLRSLPLLVIHGHDRLSLLELKDFLHGTFPQVLPKVMATETVGALALPEKFETIASNVSGAIAIITPDDIGGAVGLGPSELRTRQNVVMEIGWAWGRLGRDRCLLLVRGEVHLPSDLSGADVHAFTKTPAECGEIVRSFIRSLEHRATA
jgi:Zn-dependent protease with chaperone function